MYPRIKILVSILFLAVFINNMTAQNVDQGAKSYVDVIYLKDGSILKGALQAYEIGNFITFQLESGSTVTIPYAEVKKVVQRVDAGDAVENYNGEKIRPYLFKEKGWYNHTYLTAMPGFSEWGNLVVGVSVESTFGYRFNRYLSAGIGGGFNSFALGQKRNVFSLFAETRGYLTDNIIAPTYSLAAGYGFALKGSDGGAADAVKGGLMVLPAVGLRLGAHKGINILMDMGIKYQRATFEYNWTTEYQESYRYDFFRWNLRFGVIF